MRVTTKKWIDCGFGLSEQSNLSGLVDAGHTVAIIPRSDEAKTDAMMNYGYVTHEDMNAWAYKATMNTLGSINSKVLNVFCEGKGHLGIARSNYNKKLLKSFAKKYRRSEDVFCILDGDSEGGILRFITPCGDWWVIIAPHLEHKVTPIELLSFPMEVLQ
tara:strand:- start:13372 stop:13851 length:480 start_codon:yes stop_codon:yes gene_type:complete